MPIENLSQSERDRLTQERIRIANKRTEGLKNAVDPLVWVEFQNMEDPPGQGMQSPPFEFVLETPKGMLSFKISRFEGKEDTALRNGQKYELPLSVVNHINELKTPIYSQIQIMDKVTGAPRILTRIAGYKKRFACIPVDMNAFAVMGDEDHPKEPSRKKSGPKPKKIEDDRTPGEKAKDEQDKTNADLKKLATGDSD